MFEPSGGPSLYLHVKIGTLDVPCLIDSGATLSVVHPSVLEHLPGKTITKGEKGVIRMADGGLLEVNGNVMLDLHLGSCHAIQHTFIIAEVEAHVVIGMDFLGRHHGILDIGAKTLSLNGFMFPCKTEEDFPDIVRVIITDTQTIPPQSEMILEGHLKETPHFPTGILRPMETQLGVDSLLIANVVTNTTAGMIPVRVANISDQPQVLYRGQVTAICEPAAEVKAPQIDDNDEIGTETILDELPEYLEKLLEDSIIHLEDESQKLEVKWLLIKYSHAFVAHKDDIGRTGLVKHRINTGDAQPIKEPPRRLAFAKRQALSDEIRRLLELGIISPSTSPWGAPVVLVARKDKKTWRICLDYRWLNLCSLKDSYPLPRIDDSLDALRGASWFSTLDLASGYYQVELQDESDKEKTAFVTHEGVFQFNVMPFGLTSAPGTFERLMEKVLAGLHWSTCILYLDDVLTFSRSFEKHLDNLGAVLERIVGAGLKISPDKCQFFRRQVVFLGHVVSEEEISTDPGKVSAVTDWPRPTNVKGVRSFVGFCSYYRRFIKGFAKIAKPLHRLTEKGQSFCWNEECEEAFETLKQALVSAPILGYPQEEGSYILDADASGWGLGAVLARVQDGEERVLAYYSRTLTKAEQRYCVTRRELLALVAAVKHFHHYVYGRNLEVRTDHGALRWLLNFKNPEGQMARWIEVLQTYDITIKYRPGTQHLNADGLSRRPCESCTHCEKREDKERKLAEEELLAYEGQPWMCLIRGIREEPNQEKPWIQNWTAEQLRSWQEEDPDLKALLGWKESEEKPTWQQMRGEGPILREYYIKWNQIVLQDGVLYLKSNSPKTPGKLRLMAPREIRSQILRHLHNHRTAGHLGVKKTLGNVSERFWWPRMKEDVASWCRTCIQCQKRNVRPGRKRMLLQQDPVGAPMERMAMDILTFREETEQGNTCVLVVSCYFTKWAEAMALPDHTAITVADALVTEVFARLGVPRVIHSDQGAEFHAELMKELCKLLELPQTKTSPYHAQSDGLVERFNRTLLSMLSKFCEENKHTWDDHLPLLMCAYRASIQESTGYAPNMMMLGREITLPIDLLYPTPDQNQAAYSCPVEYVEWLKESMEDHFIRVREELNTAAVRQKKYYDQRAQMRQFQKGDWVLRFYPPNIVRSKLNFPYKGPYLVVGKSTEVTYQLQEKPQGPIFTVHVDDLKLFHGQPKEKSWLAVHNVTDDPKPQGDNVQELGSSEDVAQEGAMGPVSSEDVAQQGAMGPVSSEDLAQQGAMGPVSSEDVAQQGAMRSESSEEVAQEGAMRSESSDDVAQEGAMRSGSSYDIAQEGAMELGIPGDVAQEELQRPQRQRRRPPKRFQDYIM